jgi:hypothetical protein
MGKSPLCLEPNYSTRGAVCINNVQPWGRKIATIEGNGADCVPSPNLAAHKTDFMCLAIHPIVEPSRIRPRMSEKNDERS